MLLTLGGGAMYKEVCFAYLMLGHAPPGKFRPSEITSGAFSSKFTLSMICIYYTLLTMQPLFFFLHRKQTNSGNQVSRGGGGGGG